MIHLHYLNKTPKPSLNDVLGCTFEIAKTVLCVSVSGGNLFTLISDNISTSGRKINSTTLVFWNPCIPLCLDRQFLMVR